MTEHNCKRPNIATMDYIKGWHGETQQMINRMCLTCGRHWAGPVGAVKEYTRKEWDALIADVFSKEQI